MEESYTSATMVASSITTAKYVRAPISTGDAVEALRVSHESLKDCGSSEATQESSSNPFHFGLAFDFYSDEEVKRAGERYKRRYAYRFVKRVFDTVSSACALVVLMPLFLVVAALIKAEDGGPVFYTQKRITYGEREIDFYKFRSMRVDADRHQKELSALNEMDGPQFKIKNDPRIDSRIIETNARRPLLALVFASVFPPKNTVVSTMFPQVNSRIIPPAEAVGKFFAQTGRKTTQFSQKLAKRIFALSEGLNNRVRIPSGAAGFIQPASA